MAARRHAIGTDVGEYDYFHLTTNVTGQRITSQPSGTPLPGGGTYLGNLIVNQVGSAVTITLYDGDPGGSNFKVIGIVKPASGSDPTREYDVVCDRGLFITSTSTTAGDFTITFRDAAG